MIRRALVGQMVALPTGEHGRVSGINDQGIARVVLQGGYRDVEQEQLVSIEHLLVNRELIIRKIVNLARPSWPSFNPDVLSRRYGLELARIARALGYQS